MSLPFNRVILTAEPAAPVSQRTLETIVTHRHVAQLRVDSVTQAAAQTCGQAETSLFGETIAEARSVVAGHEEATAQAGLDHLIAIAQVPAEEVTLKAWQDQTFLRELRARALRELAGEQLEVLYTTSRPLFGLDSVMAQHPDGTPRAFNPQEQARLGQIWKNLQRIVDEGNLVGRPADQAITRIPGSGAGAGLGAIALLLRGALAPYYPQWARENLKDSDERTLVIWVGSALHPQTVADSSLEALGETAAQNGSVLIAFANESSLSPHELAQWGVNSAYIINNDPVAYLTRVIWGTWLRAT
ncbi:hypothetical protein [Gleimia hominis]|uniref:hypothetical protein n=1 Tax=Gleimia hominis TaxID=595468 RepID=UPI000C7FB068|nr:hypothetical protein [Gleimia hominis]WIK65167.1 hypothetical protein CJ187_003740 [Gleimia hominis]